MAVHVTVNKEQSLEERVNADKLILDSVNSFCTKENITAMESACSMSNHQINFVCQTFLGNFSKTPVKKIDQKSVNLNIISYISLSTDQVHNLDRTWIRQRQWQLRRWTRGVKT